MKLHQALVLTYLLVSVVVSAGRKQDCPPSTCGQLKNITDPFRLQDDPPNCGDPRYQLHCQNNRTIIEYHSGKYFVDSIDYHNQSIRITDIGLASGRCALPSHSLSYDTIGEDMLLGTINNEVDYENTVFSFVNCTQKIRGMPLSYTHTMHIDLSSLYPYTPIPCLSGNSGFVYVVNDDRTASLAPSCTFLAMVPSSWADGDEQPSNEDEVFEHLQKGFVLRWSKSNASCPSVLSQLKFCLQPAHRYEGVYSYFVEEFFNPEHHGFYNCLGIRADLCGDNKYDPSVRVKISIVVPFVVLSGLMLARFVCAPLAICAFLAKKYQETRVPMDVVENFLRNQQCLSPTRYTYIDIVVMTRHFKEKLGQGGFGSVYKGELLGGFQVAVKMLDSSKYNGDDFISEVSTIGMINHVNVVRLVGYSSEGSKRALVYEYLPKRSLDKYIFSTNGIVQRPFTWDKLNDIALGVARGIDYLHRGCNMRILHFDIKPHNILLDNNYDPKVSDFGLAKLFPKDYSIVAVSAARGTIGYIAPELISRSFGAISYKSDVYSFGMLLMEMAGGRRNVEPKAENTSQVYYPSWIYDQLNEQMQVKSQVHDDTIVKDVTTVGDVEKKLSIVGLWCIQTRPSVRPSMSRVVEMLQAGVDTLQMPPKPFLSAETVNSMSVADPSMEYASTTLSDISECESLA